MIPAEGDRQFARADVRTDGVSDGLGHAAHETGVLEFPDVGILFCCSGDVFELVVPLEFDSPPERAELSGEVGFDEVDGTLVYACPML